MTIRCLATPIEYTACARKKEDDDNSRHLLLEKLLFQGSVSQGE
jgi:hypothetical protein